MLILLNSMFRSFGCGLKQRRPPFGVNRCGDSISIKNAWNAWNTWNIHANKVVILFQVGFDNLEHLEQKLDLFQVFQARFHNLEHWKSFKIRPVPGVPGVPG
jgi:hypothetical protein